MNQAVQVFDGDGVRPRQELTMTDVEMKAVGYLRSHHGYLKFCMGFPANFTNQVATAEAVGILAEMRNDLCFRHSTTTDGAGKAAMWHIIGFLDRVREIL